eukprot:849335-Amphidinium_carterae.1
MRRKLKTVRNSSGHNNLQPCTAAPAQHAAMAMPPPPAMPYLVLPQAAYAAPQPVQMQQALSTEHFTHLVAMIQRLHNDVNESTHQLQRQQQVLAQGLATGHQVSHGRAIPSAISASGSLVGALQRNSIADNMSIVAAGHQNFYIDFVDQRERWTNKFAELHAAISPSVPATLDYQPAPLLQDQPCDGDREVTTDLGAESAQVIDSDNEEKEFEVNPS